MTDRCMTYRFCPGCGAKFFSEFTDGDKSLSDFLCIRCSTPHWWSGCGLGREYFCDECKMRIFSGPSDKREYVPDNHKKACSRHPDFKPATEPIPMSNKVWLEDCPGCGHPAPGHLPTCGSYRKPVAVCKCPTCGAPPKNPRDFRLYCSNPKCPDNKPDRIAGLRAKYFLCSSVTPAKGETAFEAVLADIRYVLNVLDTLEAKHNKLLGMPSKPDRIAELRHCCHCGDEFSVEGLPVNTTVQHKCRSCGIDTLFYRKWDGPTVLSEALKWSRIAELSEIIGLDLVKMKEKYSPSGVDGILSDGAIDADEKAMDTAAYVIRTLIEWIESCREVRDLDPRIAELREWFNRGRSDMTTMDLMRVWMSGKSFANELIDMLEAPELDGRKRDYQRIVRENERLKAELEANEPRRLKKRLKKATDKVDCQRRLINDLQDKVKRQAELAMISRLCKKYGPRGQNIP